MKQVVDLRRTLGRQKMKKKYCLSDINRTGYNNFTLLAHFSKEKNNIRKNTENMNPSVWGPELSKYRDQSN